MPHVFITLDMGVIIPPSAAKKFGDYLVANRIARGYTIRINQSEPTSDAAHKDMRASEDIVQEIIEKAQRESKS